MSQVRPQPDGSIDLFLTLTDLALMSGVRPEDYSVAGARFGRSPSDGGPPRGVHITLARTPLHPS